MIGNPSHKFCPQCGAARRRTAKVCMQCGYHFQAGSGRRTRSTKPGSATRSGEVEKTCPHCGTINALRAKVCIQCGHRFRTQFAQTQPHGLPDPDSAVAEPPITQHPDAPLILPEEFVGTARPVLPLTDNNTTTDEVPQDEPAPAMSSDELDRLREQLDEHITPYERLQRSLRHK